MDQYKTGIVMSGRVLGAPRLADPAVIARLQELSGCSLVPGTLNARLAEPLERGPQWRYLAAAAIGQE